MFLGYICCSVSPTHDASESNNYNHVYFYGQATVSVPGIPPKVYELNSFAPTKKQPLDPPKTYGKMKVFNPQYMGEITPKNEGSQRIHVWYIHL